VGGTVFGRPLQGEASIDLKVKREKTLELLEQYFPPAKAQEHVEECLRQLGIAGQERIVVGALIEFHAAAEKCLAGAIGAASAREAMKRGNILTDDEDKGLSEIYAEILADLSVTPSELRRRIDYHQEKESILTRHAGELEIRIRERDEQIAERKRAEDALRRIQEDLVRREKLAVLGQLAGSVGHELRNPLGVMNNAVYFLKTVLNQSDETVREYLDIIKQEIDKSQRIITDLLDFARTKTPRTQVVLTRHLVLEILSRSATPEQITVRTEVPEGLPALWVDPLQIGQVLQNLITNAFQAMTEGILTIRAEAGEEQTLRISVIDTGVGISSEGMARLFQPLFTTKARGIGLGLTVCKNLTEANGGRIEVESHLGEGTTFTVVLPVAEEKE
jgi:signal transduction histidine kinase